MKSHNKKIGRYRDIVILCMFYTEIKFTHCVIQYIICTEKYLKYFCELSEKRNMKSGEKIW